MVDGNVTADGSATGTDRHLSGPGGRHRKIQVMAALIGVMVAVALLPPLVTFGLLLGVGHMASATGALSLFLINLICVNLAGVTTFLVQSIRPANGCPGQCVRYRTEQIRICA